MRRPRSGRGKRGDSGVSSLELAIIAPTLLALIFLVIQGSLLFYGRSVALQAARDGVSQLRLNQTQGACESQKADVENNVRSYASLVGSGALNAPVATAECNYTAQEGSTVTQGGSTVTVTVTGHAISLIGVTWHISQSATGQVEQFRTGG